MEDWERQRVFYDTVRESIVSRDAAMRLPTGDLTAVGSCFLDMSAGVSEPIPGVLLPSDEIPAALLQRRLLHRPRGPTSLPHHVSQSPSSLYICVTAAVFHRTWLCSFALSVSAASALLLPLSIVSNEVIVLYPTSDYVQWLNPSLIKGEPVIVFILCSNYSPPQVCGTWCFWAATYHSFSVYPSPTCSVNQQAWPVSGR